MPDPREQELEGLLGDREGQLKLVARAASLVSHDGAERIDVERSKALRQCVEAARKITEIDELEDLVRRNEAAADRLENPHAVDPQGEGAEGAEGLAEPSGGVH